MNRKSAAAYNKKMFFVFFIPFIVLGFLYSNCGTPFTSGAYVSASTPIAGTGAISGTLNVTPACTGYPETVAVLSGTQAIYQTQVAPGGNFEWQLNPGTYQLAAANNGGCYVSTPITITAGNTQSGTLTLDVGNYPGQYAGSSCPYGQYGCYGSYYPGDGGGLMGKPNIYLSGDKGLRVKVALKYSEESNLLGAVPVHGPRGWHGRLDPNTGTKFVDDHGKAVSPYLFYDFRINPDKLQGSTKFCVETKKLVPTLALDLSARGFTYEEIDDFKNYWSAHLPKIPSFCVFTQENANIDPIVALDISPKPTSTTRVWYFLVPQSVVAASKVSAPSFVARWFDKNHMKTVASLKPKLPKKDSLANTERIPASMTDATPQPQGQLRVHEWGIGFLTEPTPQKPK